MSVTIFFVVIRVINVVLSALDLALLLWAIRGWRYRSSGNRFLWSGLALILAATCYGTIETFFTVGAATGWRFAMFTVALSYIGAGIVSKARGRWTEDYSERARRSNIAP